MWTVSPANRHSSNTANHGSWITVNEDQLLRPYARTIDVKNINLQIKKHKNHVFLHSYKNILKNMHKNIKLPQKHKNTCFLNCYKNIKNTFLHLWHGQCLPTGVSTAANSLRYDIRLMRQHLLQCLERQEVVPFLCLQHRSAKKTMFVKLKK